MIHFPVPEALTFDDVLLLPAHSDGVPITKNGKLVGILTNRDLRFETRFDIPIAKVMTKENLITVPVGTTLEQAEDILHEHRVEKLLVVDENYNLKGLITVKDIQKKLKYPNAAKDSHGRLRVAAAIGATGDFLERAQELVKCKADLVTIDSAHGHSSRVLEAIRSEKLLVVDENYNLKGLITVKDIQKKLKYPNAAKDSHGRLRVAAAIGATGDFLERAQELVKCKADLVTIDSAHGHSSRVLEAINVIKSKLPEVEL